MHVVVLPSRRSHTLPPNHWYRTWKVSFILSILPQGFFMVNLFGSCVGLIYTMTLFRKWSIRQFLFLKKIGGGGGISPFCGVTNTHFGPLVTSPLGFKARGGSLICTWQRYMFYMFPKIHCCNDTCWPLGSQADLFHTPASRDSDGTWRGSSGSRKSLSWPIG